MSGSLFSVRLRDGHSMAGGGATFGGVPGKITIEPRKITLSEDLAANLRRHGVIVEPVKAGRKRRKGRKCE
jgi:hypothetical protein